MVSTHQADTCILVANLHFRISFWLTAVTRLASQCRMQPTTCRTTSRAKRGRDTWSADVAVIEGSLEVKLPTYEQMQQQWWEQSGKRKKQKRSRRRERVEERSITACTGASASASVISTVFFTISFVIRFQSACVMPASRVCVPASRPAAVEGTIMGLPAGDECYIISGAPSWIRRQSDKDSSGVVNIISR